MVPVYQKHLGRARAWNIFRNNFEEYATTNETDFMGSVTMSPTSGRQLELDTTMYRISVMVILSDLPTWHCTLFGCIWLVWGIHKATIQERCPLGNMFTIGRFTLPATCANFSWESSLVSLFNVFSMIPPCHRAVWCLSTDDTRLRCDSWFISTQDRQLP